MNAIRNSLARKFGPLPAWAWALMVGVALYVFRSKLAGTAAGVGNGGTSGPGATLGYYGPYGQDFYPIQGQGGGGGMTTSGIPPFDASGSPAAPPPVINIVPAATDPTNESPPTKSTVKSPVKPRYAPAGSRHTGPQSPGRGWRGIGGGWWAPPTATKHTRPRHGNTDASHNPPRPKATHTNPAPRGRTPRPAPHHRRGHR